MNKYIPTLGIAIIILLFHTVCVADDLSDKNLSLTYSELKNKNEFWPAKITIRKKIDFNSKITLNEGDVYPLHKVNGDNVYVYMFNDSGDSLTLVLNQENTDFLEKGNDIYDNLTPEQRQITYKNLDDYKEYWPYNVEITKTVTFTSADNINVGETVVLLDNKNRKTTLSNGKMRFTVENKKCNLLQKTRENVANKSTGSRTILSELSKNLLMASEGVLVPLTEEALDEKEYFLIFKGRYGCARSRGLLPEIQNLHQKIGENNSNIQIIHYSADNDEQQMMELINAGISWPVVGYKPAIIAPLTDYIFTQETRGARLLPTLLFIDKNGTVLAKTENNESNQEVLDFVAAKISAN